MMLTGTIQVCRARTGLRSSIRKISIRRCASAGLVLDSTRSPAPKFWDYSLGHWVEDAPGDDGAFSSPGLFGFYPWITADHQTWGILARNHLAKDAWYASAQCGAVIRKAWATGKVRY